MVPHADIAERGRRQLILLSVVAIGLFALIGIAAWMRDGGSIPPGLIGRPLVVAGLAALAYQGRRLARNVLVVWLGLIGALYLFAAFAALPDNPLAALILVGAALGWIATAWRLWASAAINAYLELRRPTAP